MKVHWESRRQLGGNRRGDYFRKKNLPAGEAASEDADGLMGRGDRPKKSRRAFGKNVWKGGGKKKGFRREGERTQNCSGGESKRKNCHSARTQQKNMRGARLLEKASRKQHSISKFEIPQEKRKSIFTQKEA